MTKVIYMPKPYEIKACNKKEVINILGVSDYIATRWLKSLQPELGEPIAGLYSVKQVLLIVEKYGVPGRMLEMAA